jgi:chromosome segregation ATPase
VITDTDLFAQPKSKPARRLAELRDRRRELQAQQRQAVLDLERTDREHSHITDQIQQAEARALAHGEPDTTKADKAELAKITKRLEQTAAHADALDRAVATLADEMVEVARYNYDELLGEAVDNHAAAADRAAAAIDALHAAHAEARAAFTAAQAVHLAAGHAERTAHLRATPNVEQIVKDGGLAPLVDDRDRAAA